MIKTQNQEVPAFGYGTFKIALALATVTSMLAIFAVSANAASTPSPTPVTAACKKTYTEVVNADKVYIALQFGVVAAAKAYVASNTLTNKLLYNNSYVKAIQAANAELNFAIKSSNCYSAKNIAGYKANVKTNLTQIASIISANVNGQLVGDPKKMTTFKPVGLLK
jgi:hypothetical protein